MLNLGRIESPICKVRFRGWESNTLTLQKAGWQISMSQIPFEHHALMSLQMALRHEGLKLHGLSNKISLDQSIMFSMRSNPSFFIEHFHFEIVCMGTEIRVVYQPVDYFPVSSFSAIDAMPMMNQLNEINMSTLNIFRPISSDAPEIVIPTYSIAEMMDIALKLQDPKQTEIREKRRKEKMRGEFMEQGYDPHADIKCQILAFAS